MKELRSCLICHRRSFCHEYFSMGRMEYVFNQRVQKIKLYKITAERCHKYKE